MFDKVDKVGVRREIVYIIVGYDALLKGRVQLNIDTIYIITPIYYIGDILVRYPALDLFYIRLNHRLSFLGSIGGNTALNK